MCLCVRASQQPAGVALLAGPRSNEVAQALAKSQSVKRLSATARYLPNSVVPAEVEFPDEVKRLRQMGKLAGELGGSGFMATVEVAQDPYRIQQQSIFEGLGQNVPSVTALVYTPLDKLDATPSQLMHFGTHFTGSPEKTANALGYVKQAQVQSAVDRLAKHLTANGKVAGDAEAVQMLVGKFLNSALNLNTNKGVYVAPRWGYDVVVPATKPAQAARQVEAALAQALSARKSVPVALPPTALCTNCLQGANFSIIPKDTEHDLCGNCVGRTVQHLASPQQLQGSNMLEFTYTTQEKKALNFAVPQNRRGFPQGKIAGLPNCKAACDALNDCTGFQYDPRDDACKYYSTRNTPEYFPYDSQFYESYEKGYAKLPKTYLQTSDDNPLRTLATPEQCSSNPAFRKPQTCEQLCNSKPDCMGFAFHDGCCERYVVSQSSPTFEFSDGSDVYMKAQKRGLIGEYLPPSKTRPSAKKSSCEGPAEEAAQAAAQAVRNAAAGVAAARVAGMAPGAGAPAPEPQEEAPEEPESPEAEEAFGAPPAPEACSPPPPPPMEFAAPLEGYGLHGFQQCWADDDAGGCVDSCKQKCRDTEGCVGFEFNNETNTCTQCAKASDPKFAIAQEGSDYYASVETAPQVSRYRKFPGKYVPANLTQGKIPNGPDNATAATLAATCEGTPGCRAVTKVPNEDAEYLTKTPGANLMIQGACPKAYYTVVKE